MLEEITIIKSKAIFSDDKDRFAFAERMGQRETNRNGHHDQSQHSGYHQF